MKILFGCMLRFTGDMECLQLSIWDYKQILDSETLDRGGTMQVTSSRLDVLQESPACTTPPYEPLLDLLDMEN